NNTNNNSKGNEGNNNRGERGERGRRHHEEGWIHINERSYSAHPNGCITVVSGLGSNSFNIRNDSRKTVEFFRGVTCDNGAPVATVGPWSQSDGVQARCKDEDFKKHEHFKKDEDDEKGKHFKKDEDDEKGEHFNKDEDDCTKAVRVKNGVIGSFRIIKRFEDRDDFGDRGGRGDRGDEGGEGGDY
ncbi:hypothetical protein, partial [Streptomyces carpinensis]|uniref:hypothetical protein n=1 Tax=Streptomyces carpinensis TaxID=66369 RepID=UPI000A36923E